VAVLKPEQWRLQCLKFLNRGETGLQEATARTVRRDSCGRTLAWCIDGDV